MKDRICKEIKNNKQKLDSVSSASFSKPKINSMLVSSFASSGTWSRPEYVTSISLKHQRRVSDTHFSKKPLVKYEPLTK